jgi:hypothetical protein
MYQRLSGERGVKIMGKSWWIPYTYNMHKDTFWKWIDALPACCLFTGIGLYGGLVPREAKESNMASNELLKKININFS